MWPTCDCLSLTLKVSARVQDQYIWEKDSANLRDDLGMGADESPWVNRKHIQVRGCSKQLDPHNFIYKLLDNRWYGYCKATNQDPYEATPPEDFYTDLRRSYSHQLSKGQLVMLGGTLAYWHRGDRTASPLELCRHQGWGDDADNSRVGLPVPALEKGKQRAASNDASENMENVADDPETARKRRRKSTFRKLPDPDAKTSELAGQAMCIPDALSVFYCMQLACDTGVWASNSPSLAQCMEMMGKCDESEQQRAVPIVVDLDADPRELANIFGMTDAYQDDSELFAEDVEGDDSK